MFRHVGITVTVAVLAVGLLAVSTVRADVDSGPAAGTVLEELKVHAVTGDVTDREVDYVAERAGKPTVYVFIPADKWSRPAARFLRTLDQKVTGVDAEARIVAVWLTADIPSSKEYLPRAQMSVKFEHTALTVFSGDQNGPPAWGVNTDADATVVVARGGKSVARHGYVSVNETVVDDVLRELKGE